MVEQYRREIKFRTFPQKEVNTRKLIISLKLLFLATVSLPDNLYLVAIFFITNGLLSNLRYFHAENIGLKEFNFDQALHKATNRLFMGIDIGVTVVYYSFLLTQVPPYLSFQFATLILSIVVGIIRAIMLSANDDVKVNELMNLFVKVRRFLTVRKREAVERAFILWEDFLNEKQAVLTKFEDNFSLVNLSFKDAYKEIDKKEEEMEKELEEIKKNYHVKFEDLKKEYSDVLGK